MIKVTNKKIMRNKELIRIKTKANIIKKAIQNQVKRMEANKSIRNVIKRPPNHQGIRMGFIVQLPAIWDKQEGIYQEASKRENITTFLFVVPEHERRNQIAQNSYESNYFLGKYPEAINIYNSDGSIIDLHDYDLDYLFYPRPYDAYLPYEIRSYIMYRHTKCCYVPYGFTGADVFNGGNVDNVFFHNIYFCFMDSEYMKGLLADRYTYEIKKGIKRIEYLGYPNLEKYLQMGDSGKFENITWTPRWSYDEKLGGSNFLEYKEAFLNLQKTHKGKMVFRPHPLMFGELEKCHLMSEEEKKEYINILIKHGTIIDINSPIDTVLRDTDVLISDFSTIVGSFFLTGRPIIYCDKGIVLNRIYAEMVKHMYVAYSWEDVEKYYRMLVIDKNDPKKEERKKYIQAHYSQEKNASKKIVDAIISDSKRR